jgi:predicted O-methyltransferase YrrM
MRVGLAERPAHVLFTAMMAMGVLKAVSERHDRLDLTDMAREHLLPGGDFFIGDYFSLAAQSPGVLEMVERLRTNRPASAKKDEGAAFIYREGMDSAMEREESARRLTLALAGRAKNVAPLLAARLPLPSAKLLVDVGGGTGIYSIALLQANPRLMAIVWDRPEVLRVAKEMAAEYGVTERLQLVPGDMFTDRVPQHDQLSGDRPDVILLSNVLHDWDVPECQALVRRCADALAPGGRMLIHDVFLNDALDGPLPVALYSAALFTLTKGRAYSAGEYRQWMSEADLTPGEVIATLIHCGVLVGRKG